MRSHVKRVFDLTFSLLGLLVLWPVLAAVALGIKLSGGGRAFFRQQRVGLGGRIFKIWKFRTMVENAEQLGKLLTVGPDPRITPIGFWLRRSKLDELPQLFNVLRGDMSLVGPRPEVPHYVERYSAGQRRVLNLMPGITDPASIRYRNENDLLATSANPEQTYTEEIMPEKIRLNLEYAVRANLATDFAVILKTVFGREEPSANSRCDQNQQVSLGKNER